MGCALYSIGLQASARHGLLLIATVFLSLSCTKSSAKNGGESCDQTGDGVVSTPAVITDVNNSARKLVDGDCDDPSLAGVLTTETFTLCNGEEANGQLDVSTIQDKLLIGTLFGGIEGTMYPTFSCRNGRGNTNSGFFDDLAVNNDDSVDDFQNGDVSFYTGTDRTNCDESNFVDVTNGAGLVPDDALRVSAAGGMVWDKIYQDQKTGLYITNPLGLDGTADYFLFDAANTFCKALNGGSAGSNWRLPTQKELMQIYINGFSRFLDLGDGTKLFWSSTTSSEDDGDAWVVNLSTGKTDTRLKTNQRGLVCVKSI